MKQMKFIMIILCSIILLSGCNKKETKEETKLQGTVNTLIESKKSTIKTSSYEYINAINNYITLSLLENKSLNIPDNETCTITNKTTYNDECKLVLNNITIKGDKPDSGTFKIVNYTVSEAKLVYDGYTSIYDGTNINVVKE